MRKRTGRMLSLLTAFTLLVQVSGYQPVPSAQASEVDKGYLVGLKSGINSDAFLKKHSLTGKKSKKLHNTRVLSVPLTNKQVQELKASNEVAYVEENAKVQIASTDADNDPSEQTVATDTVPWGVRDIGGELTLPKHLDGSGINVAVLDTGVATHSDLKVAGGVSFVDNANGFADDNGHGTHVIGSISALENHSGVVGVAPNVNLYAVKVLDQNGSGSYDQVIDGIHWAIDNGMNVISMSFGSNLDSQALHDAVKEASDKGILIVAAAGNNGSGEETEIYPARYPEVLSVGAIDASLQRASFSSTGNELDLVAPGVQILSTTKDGQYGVMSGTSMSTPHVAGAAAALWSTDKTLTAQTVRQKLLDTAMPLGDSHEYGHGLVNLAKAVGLTDQAVAIPQTDTTTPSSDPGTNPPPSTSVQEVSILSKYDSQYLLLGKQLLALKEQALSDGNNALAKKIEQSYNDLQQLSIDLHKLPSAASQYSKQDLISMQSMINDYYKSKEHDLIKLQDTYNSLIKEYSQEFTAKSISTASFGKTGDGQSIAPGDSAAVSLQLYSTQSTVNISVYNAQSPNTIITSTTLTNQQANTPINYSWYSSTGTQPGTYTIHFNYPQNGTTAYDDYFTITVTQPTLVLNTPIDADFATGSNQVYKFTPAYDGTYKFFTSAFAGTGAANDTVLELYSDAALTNLVVSNDDYNTTTFSQISTTLSQGMTYYLKLRPYSSSLALHARLTAQVNMLTTTTLSLNTPIDVDLASGKNRVFQFTPTTSMPYRIFTDYFGGTSTSGTSDTEIFVYSDANLTNQMTFNDDKNGTFSEVSPSLTAGTTYYIKLVGFYNVAVHARISIVQAPITFTAVSNNSTSDVSTNPYESKYLKFTPTVSGTYKFATGGYGGSSIANDTMLTLYSDEAMTTQLATNDDANGTSFSEIQYALTAGTTYYVKLSGYTNRALYCSFSTTLMYQSLDYWVGKGTETPVFVDNHHVRVYPNGKVYVQFDNPVSQLSSYTKDVDYFVENGYYWFTTGSLARTNSVTIDSTKVTIVITDQAVLDMLKNPPDPTLSSASVKIDSASNCLSNCQYTVFIVAGIDTTSCKASSDDCFFLDGMMKVPTRLLSGKSVKVVDLYPYGTSDNFMSDDWLTDAEWLTFVLAQVATIKSDMTLSPYLSVGGHFVANAAMNSKVNGGINSKFVFLGHSGGGVASYLGAQLLEHDNGKTVQQVVQIGSPIMDFDSINYPNLAAKTDFVYANNFGDDPVPILGLLSQQVGPPSGYRFGSQNPRNIRSVKIAPQSNPMSIHMSYFWDTNWTDSSGTWHNNIDSLYDLISPWVQ